MKRMVFTLSILSIIVVVIPALLVLPYSKQKEDIPTNDFSTESRIDETMTEATVPVYRTELKQLETIPLERYVFGVLASEMPAEFELEALKAQALAARTYIVKQLIHEPEINVPEGAAVTDTTLHQVYRSPEELRDIWGKDYNWKEERIYEAVKATAGKILTYDSEPITASFFSTSNGYTENAEDYWENALPYLKSVSSPWDLSSPKYTTSEKIPVPEFEEKLGITLGDAPVSQNEKRTTSERVATIDIGNKTFTGREVRETLNLNSTDFSFERQGNAVIVHTKGYGHGVGMSQYGANGMAREGKTAEEIVAYYYQGVEVVSASPFTAKLTARKDE